MHAKGSGAFVAFTVMHDATKWARAKIFEQAGMKTELFTRFSTVAGGRGAATLPTARRPIRLTAPRWPRPSV